MANSVDELKALANTKLGFARANRFLVTLPTSFGGGGGLLQGIIGLLTGGGGGAYYQDSGGVNKSGTGGNGGSGFVVIKYPNTLTITVGAGLTSSTSTSGDYKITQFTAGTDTINFKVPDE